MGNYHLDFKNVSGFAYEMGPIRPPSEGQDRSLLLRLSRNCPWNRCLFCSTYRGKKFEYRSVDEIKRDIDIARAISDGLKSGSLALGYDGTVNQTVVDSVIAGTPEVYGKQQLEPGELMARYSCLSNVANWLNAGARTVFLQDGNSIIMRVADLLEVLEYLRTTFPSIERITSYARSRTLSQRSLESLRSLREAGLIRLHVGMESGCDEVLAFMQKGATAEDHIKGGQKVVQAGMSLSEYVMPGLGGRKWSGKHALESARVINQVNPDFVRLRSLTVRANLPLHEKMQDGEFDLMSEDEMVAEIGLFIENLDCNSYLVSDQMSNLLWEVEGKLPDQKREMLAIINQYQSMDEIERLSFVLGRRARSYVSVHGGIDDRIGALVEEAVAAIRAEDLDAAVKTDRALMALKTGFV